MMITQDMILKTIKPKKMKVEEFDDQAFDYFSLQTKIELLRSIQNHGDMPENVFEQVVIINEELGEVNQAVQTYDSTAFDYRTNVLRLFIRQQGKTFDQTDTTDIGLVGGAQLPYNTQRFPLVENNERSN